MFKYKILEHIADLKIQAQGKSLEELFSNLAYGLSETIYPELAGEKIKKTRKIKVEGFDQESLLINFLNELIYLSDVKGEVYKDLKLKIKNNSLEATLLACPVKSKKIEVKAATYYNLKIEKEDNLYKTVVTFDI